MGKRMFVAIDLPEEVRAGLAGLDPRLAGLRWLGASQMHLTLCFLGEVAEEREGRLIAGLAAIRVARFSLALKGLGCFARNRQPAVVWAGVAHAAPGLFRLHQQVGAAVLAAELGADLTAQEKPFHPHVTVGRCKGVAAAVLQPLLERHEHSDFGAFEVSGFTLYASILHPHGPEYQSMFHQDLETA